MNRRIARKVIKQHAAGWPVPAGRLGAAVAVAGKPWRSQWVVILEQGAALSGAISDVALAFEDLADAIAGTLAPLGDVVDNFLRQLADADCPHRITTASGAVYDLRLGRFRCTVPDLG